MFTTQTFYSPELGKNITVRNLSAAGVVRVHNARSGWLPIKAQKVALICEHLRDGIVDPPIKENEDLLDFLERYPDLAIRIFATIRHLTELAEASHEQGS